MSVLCQNFVQNAWKQELCSNCYRAKNEHGLSNMTSFSSLDVMNSRCLVLKSTFHDPSVTTSSTTTPATTTTTTWKGLAMQNSRCLAQKVNGSCPPPPLAGILKGGLRRRPPFQERQLGSVGFREEAPQVIGYGGDSQCPWNEDANGVAINGKWGNGEEAENNAGSGDEDDDDDLICNGDGDSLENFDLSEEEREFAQLTEKNTEYNSIPRNLVQDGAADQPKVKFSGSIVARGESQDPVRNPILDPIEGTTEVARATGTVISVSPETDDPRENGESVNSERESNPILLISKEVVVVENHRIVVDHEAFSVTDDSERSSSDLDSPTADPTLVPPPDYMVNDASDDLAFEEPVTRLSVTCSDEKNVPNIPNGHPDLHYCSSPVVKGVLTLPERNSYPVPYRTSPVEQQQSPPGGQSSMLSSPKQNNAKTKPKVPMKPNKLAPNEELVANGGDSSPRNLLQEKRLETPSSPTSLSSNESSPPPSQVNSSEQNGHQESEEGTENESSEEKKDLSFQAKVAAISNNLDLSRRNAKRQAPMPPPHSPEVTRPPRTSRGKLVLPINAVHRPLQPWESDPGPRSATPTPVSTPTVSTPSPAQPQRPAPLSPTVETPSRRFSCGLKNKSPSLESGIAFSRFPCIPSHDYAKEVKKLKSKFSLKKFLKFGKDGDECRGKGSGSGGQSSLVERRTRIEILHPIDLANMAASSPTSSDDVNNRVSPTDSVFYETPIINDQHRNSSPLIASMSSACLPSSVDDEILCSPPFPPPRTRATDGPRPVRPPPPTVSPLNFAMSLEAESGSDGRQVASTIPADSRLSPGGEYANLGDARTVLAPKKPERGSPASCRREANQMDASRALDNGSPTIMTNHLYEFIPVSHNNNLQNSTERTYYEPPSMSPSQGSTHRSSTRVTVNSEEAETGRRWRRQVRPAGVTWVATDEDSGDAGSESSGGDAANNNPLSALYAEVRKPKAAAPIQSLPISLATSDPTSSSLSEDEPPSSPPSIEWPQKLLFNGGRRAVFTRGLQENYGAVTAANHEALSQLLEQLLQSKSQNNAILGGLKDATLRWSDFTLETKTPTITLKHASFYNATWKDEVSVTLMATDEMLAGPLCTRNPFVLSPVTTFQDWVPSSSTMGSCLQRGRVAVLERLHVQTLPDFIVDLRAQIETDVDLFERGSIAVMLQLLSALKHLQAEGVEEVPENDVWMVVHRGDPFRFAWRLSMLPVEAPSTRTSLCECAVRVMLALLHGEVPDSLPNRKAFQAVIDQLRTERATSLSKAKAVLEFLLWGPAELQTSDPDAQIEANLQQWLDLERALTLTNLIRWQSNATLDIAPLDQLRLLFVVRTSARTLREAAALATSTASNA